MNILARRALLGSASVAVCAALLVACGSSVDVGPSDPAGPPGFAPVPADLLDGGATREASPGDSAGPDAPVDRSAVVATFADQLASAICARAASCCSESDYAAFIKRFTGGPNEEYNVPADYDGGTAQCGTLLKTQFSRAFKQFIDPLNHGGVVFDAARAKAVLGEIGTATCGAPLGTALNHAVYRRKANEVFRASLPLGASCLKVGGPNLVDECDPVLGFCAGVGICTAYRSFGESCEVLDVSKRALCRPESYCESDQNLTNWKCIGAPVAVALGEVCSALDGPFLECPAAAFCDFAGGGATTCKTRKVDGEACRSDGECATSRAYSCWPNVGGTCGSNAFCNKNALPPPAPLRIAREEAPLAFAPQVTVGQRERVYLDWSTGGGGPVSLTGAGDTVVVVRDGTPTYDNDVATGTEVAPNTIFGSKVFSVPVNAKLPFVTSILGDVWGSGAGDISISPRGVVSRGAITSIGADLAGALPMYGGGAIGSSWADGTLAAFFDSRLGSDDAGTSRIRYKAYGGAGDPDRRFVVEWANMTTTVLNTTRKLPIARTFQLAIYADGRVELRFKAPNRGPTPNDADDAIVAGQGATIGLASSTADPARAIPLSVRRPSLPLGAGITYSFLAHDKLPASGRALVTTPAVTGAVSYVLTAGATVATTVADVVPMYTVTRTVDAIPLRDISALPGVKDALPSPADTIGRIELPFALGVFHEGWRSLAVAPSGAIGPWGAASLLNSSVNATVPSAQLPNGYLAAFRPLSGDSWVLATYPDTNAFKYLVEGAAPSRKVTVMYKGVGLGRDTVTANHIDFEVVLGESGDVEYHYGNLSSSSPVILGVDNLIAIENGNGDVGIKVGDPLPADISKTTHVLFTRQP